MRAVYFTRSEEYSPLTLLSREDERRLRAQAWRHVRRINPKVARQIWRAHHPRLKETAMKRALRKWKRGVKILGKGTTRRKWRLYDYSTAHYAVEVIA